MARCTARLGHDDILHGQSYSGSLKLLYAEPSNFDDVLDVQCVTGRVNLFAGERICGVSFCLQFSLQLRARLPRNRSRTRASWTSCKPARSVSDCSPPNSARTLPAESCEGFGPTWPGRLRRVLAFRCCCWST